MIGAVPIKQSQGIETILDVINNAKIYGKRIKDMEALRAEVNSAIKILNMGKGIQKSLENAQKRETEAQNTLESARTQARELLSKAQRESKIIENAISKNLSDSEARVTEIDARVQTQRRALETAMRAREKAENEAKRILQEAEAVHAEAIALKGLFMDKMEKLKALSR